MAKMSLVSVYLSDILANTLFCALIIAYSPISNLRRKNGVGVEKSHVWLECFASSQ